MDRIPIFLLPGMDGTGELLEDLASRLTHSRRVQIISFPLEQPLGYDALTSFVAAQLPGEPFAVLGESFSGPIAIEIAASVPHVAGLILASSFAYRPFPRLFAPFAGAADPRLLPPRLIESALLGRAAPPALRLRLQEVLRKLTCETLSRQTLKLRAAEALRVDKRRRLRTVPCPVMCLHGNLDRLTGARCLRQILLAKPDCEVRRLAAPHMLLETHPAESAAFIEEFCGAL